MAVVRLGPNGEVEMLVPPTPEEEADAEAGLLKLIEALARVVVEEEWAAMQGQSGPADRQQG